MVLSSELSFLSSQLQTQAMFCFLFTYSFFFFFNMWIVFTCAFKVAWVGGIVTKATDGRWQLFKISILKLGINIQAGFKKNGVRYGWFIMTALLITVIILSIAISVIWYDKIRPIPTLQGISCNLRCNWNKKTSESSVKAAHSLGRIHFQGNHLVFCKFSCMSNIYSSNIVLNSSV